MVPTWQTSTKVSIANKENFYRAVKNFSNDTGFLFAIRELLLSHEFTEMILSKGDDSIVIDNYKTPDQYVAVFFMGNDSALNSALVDKYSRCCLEGFE